MGTAAPKLMDASRACDRRLALAHESAKTRGARLAAPSPDLTPIQFQLDINQPSQPNGYTVSQAFLLLRIQWMTDWDGPGILQLTQVRRL